MKIIIITLAVSILFYLGGSFAFASFDIEKWDGDVRQRVGFLCVGVILAIFASANLNKYLNGK